MLYSDSTVATPFQIFVCDTTNETYKRHIDHSRGVWSEWELASSNDLSALINMMGIGNSDPTDNDYYISQYSGGGTTNTTYWRRSHKQLWNYIKGKADDFYMLKSVGATDVLLNGRVSINDGDAGSVTLSNYLTNYKSIIIIAELWTGNSNFGVTSVTLDTTCDTTSTFVFNDGGGVVFCIPWFRFDYNSNSITVELNYSGEPSNVIESPIGQSPKYLTGYRFEILKIFGNK